MKILGQVLDPGLGFGAVAGANIDDVLQVRRAQEFSAPVNGPMNGTFLAFAIGTVTDVVGVPTAPINAKTLSSSSNLTVCTIERSDDSRRPG